MPAYSFVNVQASIAGPGGAFSLGYGNGNAEEGITVSMNGEKVVMTEGAGGEVMFSLLASRTGKISVHLLKTSPVNAKLMAMYDLQNLSSATVGNNIITITDSASGEVTTCRQVAFLKKPDLNYAKEGGSMTWEFVAGYVDSILGTF